jgi:flagellar hook assembly protein FlgD
VRTLVDEVQEPGYYTVTWDGKDSNGRGVVSGVYFYRLSVNGGQWSATQKMVLMK